MYVRCGVYLWTIYSYVTLQDSYLLACDEPMEPFRELTHVDQLFPLSLLKPLIGLFLQLHPWFYFYVFSWCILRGPVFILLRSWF